MSKCRESSPVKGVCTNTVEHGVSNSSLEFERLRKQAKLAKTVRSLRHTGEVHRYELPEGAKVFEVPKQQYTDLSRSRHRSEERRVAFKEGTNEVMTEFKDCCCKIPRP